MLIPFTYSSTSMIHGYSKVGVVTMKRKHEVEVCRGLSCIFWPLYGLDHYCFRLQVSSQVVVATQQVWD